MTTYKTKKKRPKVLKGETRCILTGCGDLFITLNEDTDGNLLEVFARLGKAGGCGASINETLGRLVSLSLRLDGNPRDVIKQLSGITCHQKREAVGDTPAVLSCADGIAILMKEHLEEKKHDSKPAK